jgi:hypothetical protein
MAPLNDDAALAESREPSTQIDGVSRIMEFGDTEIHRDEKLKTIGLASCFLYVLPVIYSLLV